VAGFDLVIVETSGIGQGDAAIVPHVDTSMYVMTPEFGAASQLEKIDMLDFADLIAINKFDRKGALDALRDGAKGDGNLLELAVECARRRATLGEISAAMEDVFGRFGTQPTPVKGVYGGAYKEDGRWERLLRGVEAVERRLGRKPRMFVAKMGQDGHDRGANLVSSMFGDLGFEVVPGPLFQTPKEASELALEKDVDVVGASSLAAG
ncbi:hypothetical protein LTR94_030953, partial [Friedmanniomyces endolithicus]